MVNYYYYLTYCLFIVMLDSRPRGRGFEPHQRHCGPCARHIYPSLVLVQPRKTRPCLNERLLMGRKESNQTNYLTYLPIYSKKIFEENIRTSVSHRIGGNRKYLSYRRT